MPRGTAYDAFKRDNLLLEFIRQHRGEANLVSSREVRSFLNEHGYQMARYSIGNVITRVMYERNAPICYSSSKGYYWAASRTEIEKTIADMKARQESLQEHIDHLRGFIVD